MLVSETTVGTIVFKDSRHAEVMFVLQELHGKMLTFPPPAASELRLAAWLELCSLRCPQHWSSFATLSAVTSTWLEEPEVA